MAGRRVRTRIVHGLPDGTVTVPLRGDAYWLPSHFPSLQLDRSIDAGSAIQLGCFEVLAALRFFSVDTEALVAGLPVQDGYEAREMKFERLFMDWATVESDTDPIPSVAIRILGNRVYNADNLSLGLVEETVDKFGPGTVLKKVSHMTCTIRLDALFAHKDDRQGCAKALEDALLGEVDDERAGRHVVVKAYYDRVVRFILTGIDYPDDSRSAHENQWELHASLSADVDVVQLVKAPASLLPPYAPVDGC